MQDAAALSLTNLQLQRGEGVSINKSKRGEMPIESMIELVKPHYMVVSFVQTEETLVHLLGATVQITLETDTSVSLLTLEVIQEQTLWPVKMLGLLPLIVETKEISDVPLIKPDFIINVPYKVMGAKPMEEKGEGVVLEFSPYRLVLGTDGYVAKGDFINLSFIAPRTKLEIVAMARVTDKTFMEGSAVVTLTFTDMDQKHFKVIQEYYLQVKS